jgi:hypothetical protein
MAVTLVGVVGCTLNPTDIPLVTTNQQPAVSTPTRAIPTLSIVSTATIQPTVASSPEAVATPTQVPETPLSVFVAVVAYDSTIAQIWEIAGLESRLFYQQHSLVATERSVPENFRNQVSRLNENLDQVQLGVFIGGVRVSPSLENVAWFENFQWCPDPTLPECLQFTSLKVQSINTGIVQEMPADHALTTSLQWSPDSKFLAFSTQEAMETGGTTNETWIVDIATGNVVSRGDGFVFAWGSDSNQLVVAYRAIESPSYRLKIIPLNAEAQVERIVDYDWLGGIEGVSWGTNQHYITVAGNTDPTDVAKAPPLYLIDPDSLQVAHFEVRNDVPQVLSSPQWSLDARLLAVNASRSQQDNVTATLIIDPAGAVIGNFPIPGGSSPPEFSWSARDNKLLRLLHLVPPTKDDVQIIDPISASLETVKLPAQVVTGIDDFSIYISSVDW